MVAAASQPLFSGPNFPQADRAAPPNVDAGLTRQILLDRVIDLLVQKAVAQVYWPEVYAKAKQLLQAAPLASGVRRVAFQRIRNAQSYAVASEFGAAAYELRMLRTRLA